MVEYVEVLVLVTIGMAVATAGLGRLLLRYFDVIDALVSLPLP